MRDLVVGAASSAGARGASTTPTLSGLGVHLTGLSAGARPLGTHPVGMPWIGGGGGGAGAGGHQVARLLTATPSFTPTGGGPGSGAIQQLLNWGGWFALVACLAGLMIGAAMWAHAATNGSYGGVHRGKQYVMGGAIGALVLGIAPLLISTLFATGGH